MKLPGRERAEPEAPVTHEKSRLCPECGTPVSMRATTCAICGYDFVAAEQAEQAEQAELREEAAQRPVRAIAIGLTAAVALLLIAALYFRNRAEAIAALTPTTTPTTTTTPTPSRTPTPTPTPLFTPTPIPPREYLVQPGDNIFYIADIFQVDYRDLLAFNNLTENSVLQVSQKILIPPPTATPTPSATPQDATAAPAPGSTGIVHVVQAGETLIGIAQKYGVTVSVILQANQIEDANQIRVGDQLIIPQASAATTTPGSVVETPQPSYGPVTLLQPLNGSRITGNQRNVLLQWLSAGILNEDETYRLTLEQVDGDIRYGPVYIKATALHVPLELFPAPDDPHRTFQWAVTIMRQVGVGSDGAPLYAVISPPSSRIFHWMPALPTPTLTPIPPFLLLSACLFGFLPCHALSSSLQKVCNLPTDANLSLTDLPTLPSQFAQYDDDRGG